MPNIQAVPIVESDISTAFHGALERSEPVFVPVHIYVDDRGWSIMNQLQGVMESNGQINYSVMYPNVVKAWHRHEKQTDFWLCVAGHLKAGIYRDDGATWQLVFGERKPGVMIVPPRLWHGAATVGAEPAGLLYYVTRAYCPESPDEERRPFDSVAGFPWEVQFR